MLKAFKKSPQKKTDTLDDVILTIEFQLKKLLQKTKCNSEQMDALGKGVQFIERAVNSEVIFKVADLYKEFTDASALVTKLSKDFETFQKRLHKTQTEFEKKLSTPLASGIFNSLKPAALEEIKSGVRRIQDLLTRNKDPLKEMIELIQIFSRKLATIENKVHAICLPEQLEELHKLNEKLNKCAETLCKETAGINLSANPQPGDTQKIKSTLLLLFANHQRGGQLLDQAQRNLGPMAGNTAVTAVPAPAPNAVAAAAAPATPSVVDAKTNSPT